MLHQLRQEMTIAPQSMKINHAGHNNFSNLKVKTALRELLWLSSTLVNPTFPTSTTNSKKSLQTKAAEPNAQQEFNKQGVCTCKGLKQHNMGAQQKPIKNGRSPQAARCPPTESACICRASAHTQIMCFLAEQALTHNVVAYPQSTCARKDSLTELVNVFHSQPSLT